MDKNHSINKKIIPAAVEEGEIKTTYQYKGEPLKVGVVGLVHTHVHWILGREKVGDIEIVVEWKEFYKD